MIKLEAAESYSEDKGWNGCEKIRMDQSQSSRELAFPSSSIEEPKKRKKIKSVLKLNTPIHEYWPHKRAVPL